MERKVDFIKNYKDYVKHLKTVFGDNLAMSKAVGGDFEYVGSLEYQFLVNVGLKPTDHIIDIGCGSGRLAYQLANYLTDGHYLGTDVVPELLEYAKNLVDRDNFRFELTNGFVIPEQDKQADWVVLFSVFTHLMQEEIYIYLKEIKRVLKPDGKVVFSFFEFTSPGLWHIFEEEVKNIYNPHPLNIFISRDAINAWAEHLGMEVVAYYDSHIRLVSSMKPAKKDDGTLVDTGVLGQSVCIMRNVI